MNLDDSRIAAMRHQIMTEVTSDQRRRTHRLRSGVAAFMGVLVIGGIGIATIPNLGSDGELLAGSESANDSTAELPPPAAEQGDEDFSEEPPPILGRGDDPVFPELDPLPDPSIVQQTEVHIVVEDSRAAVRDVVAWTEEFDGVVVASRESNRDDESRPEVSVRFPSGTVDEAIADLGRFGEIDATDVQNTNVTTDVADLDTEIRALQGSITRLNAIVERAESTSDVLDAERNLTQREAELDDLLTQRENLADQVSMSAVTITFADDDSASGLWGVAVAALPWLGLLVAASVVGWLFVRRGRDEARPVNTRRAVNQWS